MLLGALGSRKASFLNTKGGDLSPASQVCWWGHSFARVCCGPARLKGKDVSFPKVTQTMPYLMDVRANIVVLLYIASAFFVSGVSHDWFTADLFTEYIQ